MSQGKLNYSDTRKLSIPPLYSANHRKTFEMESNVGDHMNLRKIAQLIGLGAIIYLSFQNATLQTAILLSNSKLDPQMQQDEISLYEARLSNIKDDLRSVNGVIGYLSCPEPDTAITTYHYSLTQYVLAPISLDDNLDNVLVLGNFPPELCNISSINLKQNNLSVIREYGNGLFLLEHGD